MMHVAPTKPRTTSVIDQWALKFFHSLIFVGKNGQENMAGGDIPAMPVVSPANWPKSKQ